MQAAQAFETVPGKEQLERLVEQSRRRDIGQQRRQLGDRCFGFRGKREIELGRETGRAQHAYRILAVALLRITDQSHRALLQVGNAPDVVAHAEIGDVVIERVDREVAADCIFLDAAVDVVADDAAVDHVAVAVADFADAAESRHFDDFAAEHDMCEAKTAADQPAVAEQRPGLFGRRIGGDVEILRVAAEEQVAYGAADEERLVPGFVQPVQDAQRAVGDVLARNAMFGAGNDARNEFRGVGIGFQCRRCGPVHSVITVGFNGIARQL